MTALDSLWQGMESSAVHRTLSTGEMLNWYRIERVLGRGGFGVIYLATDTNLDHPVAIKEYIPAGFARREGDIAVHPLTDRHGAQYREGLERFITEARNLVRFKHPNIVRVMSVFQKNNTAYMVMEFELGECLNRYLERAGTCSESRLKSLIRPVAEGLAEVHRHGFIHRDIKPGNIMVRPDGSPVLLDFGSARDANIGNGEALTAVVTVGYAPLEQYTDKNDEQQGPWTDIYALGGVLYYAISGGDPVDSARRGSALLNGGRDPMMSANSIGRGRYSEDFLAAIDWALSFRVADRPQTLADWLPALLGRTSIKRLRCDAMSIDTLMDVTGSPATNDALTETELRGRRRQGNPARRELPVRPATAPATHAPRSSRRRHTGRRGLHSLLPFAIAIAVAGIGVLWATRDQPVDATSDLQVTVLSSADGAAIRDELNAEALVAERLRQVERLAEIERRERALAERQYAADAAAVEASRIAELAKQQRAETARLEAEEAAHEAEAVERRERLLREARQRQAEAAQEHFAASLADAEAAISERNISAATQALADARGTGLSRPRLGVLEARLERVVAEMKRPITDAEFDRVVRRFDGLKRAIESKDVAVIDALTRESEQTGLFRQLMLNFETLNMEITGIRVRNASKTVTANLRIRDMVRKNGDTAVPSAAFRDRELTSRLVDGEWSRIAW